MRSRTAAARCNTTKTRQTTPPPDEMALEAEFGAIQSGRLNLEQAPTFNRIAIERGQSVHQIYNETFARESRRLQDEEEEQVNREIDQFIAKFPKIFSLPKRKELIAQVRELLTNAKSEKYGKLDEGNGWTCFENNDHTYLVSSKIQERGELSDATALIGQNVVTESGKEGKLICGSGMGVTPIDVFNEVMTKPADLRQFLGEENWKESETLALSIKSYLKFCKMLEIKPWSPVSPDDELRVDYEHNYEEMDVATQYDEVMTIQPTKKKRPSHHQPTELGEKAKKTRKVVQKRAQSDIVSFNIDDILAHCPQCHVDGSPNRTTTCHPNMFDRELSRHLLEVHNERDDYQRDLDMNSEWREQLKPSDFTLDGATISCTVAVCTFSYPKGSYVALGRMSFHAHYHRELGKHGKTLGAESFPCPYCDVAPFADFGQWKTHKYQNHPDFMWRCRYPECEFINSRREHLTSHWKGVHFPKQLACEICGKVYKDLHQFKIHKKGHDRSHEVSCDQCGKVFPTKYQFNLHKKAVHEKNYKCPLCEETFRRPFNVDAHLVHDHGQERKYPCQFCPASFIRSTHYNRHVKQFHSDPTNMKMPQVRYRGPNRSQRRDHPSSANTSTESVEQNVAVIQEVDLTTPQNVTDVRMAPINKMIMTIKRAPPPTVPPSDETWQGYE